MNEQTRRELEALLNQPGQIVQPHEKHTLRVLRKAKLSGEEQRKLGGSYMDRIVEQMSASLAIQRKEKIKEQLLAKGIDENVPLRGIMFADGGGVSYYFDEVFILWVSDLRVEPDPDQSGRIGAKMDFSTVPPAGKDVFGVDKAFYNKMTDPQLPE